MDNKPTVSQIAERRNVTLEHLAQTSSDIEDLERRLQKLRSLSAIQLDEIRGLTVQLREAQEQSQSPDSMAGSPT